MEFVRDLMSPEPRWVSGDTPLADCAARMVDGGLRVLPVFDAGRLIGIVTAASVFGRGRFEGGGWSFGDQVAAEAALPAVSVAEDAPAAKGIRKLIGRDAVVVLGAEGGVVGVLTEHDAVRLAPDVLPADLTVGEVASRPVSTVMAHAPLLDAWEDLRGTGRRHLVVTDPRGVATDVLSLRDLVRAGIRPDDPRTVSQICTQPELVTVDLHARVQDAARRMAISAVGCLPSVDPGGMPVAILTRSDVLRVLAGHLQGRPA